MAPRRTPKKRHTGRAMTKDPSPQTPGTDTGPDWPSQEERGIAPGAEVALLYKASEKEPYKQVGIATLWQAGSDFGYLIHHKDVRRIQKPGHDVCLLRVGSIEDDCKTLPYPYAMPDNEEQPPPKVLEDMKRFNRYAWDRNMMVEVSKNLQDMLPKPVDRTTTPLAASSTNPPIPDIEEEILPQKSHLKSPLKKRPVTPQFERPQSPTLQPSLELPKAVATPASQPGPALSAESDGEVVEVPVVHVPDDPVQLSPSDKDVLAKLLEVSNVEKHDNSHYQFDSLYVQIATVTFPRHTVRETDEEHLEKVGELYDREGFRPASGSISVTVMDAEVLKNLKQHIKPLPDGKRCLDVPSLCCDGNHRTTYLHAKIKSAEGKAKYEYVPAVLWTRKDRKPMDGMELLSAGVGQNDTTSTVKVATFADNLHTAMSFLANIVEMTQVNVISEGIPTAVLCARKGFPTMPERNVKKYAKTAIAFRK